MGVDHEEMSSWQQFHDEAPGLADKVLRRLTAHKHHVMATIRADGSPRVSGTEVPLVGDELCIGSMWGARKARDLHRDPRVAIHTNPGDETMDGGDAKLAAVAEELDDDHPLKESLRAGMAPPEPFHLFRLDLRDVVLTELDGREEHLEVHLWQPGQGVATTVV